MRPSAALRCFEKERSGFKIKNTALNKCLFMRRRVCHEVRMSGSPAKLNFRFLQAFSCV
jgi:hypothetical protein